MPRRRRRPRRPRPATTAGAIARQQLDREAALLQGRDRSRRVRPQSVGEREAPRPPGRGGQPEFGTAVVGASATSQKRAEPRRLAPDVRPWPGCSTTHRRRVPSGGRRAQQRLRQRMTRVGSDGWRRPAAPRRRRRRRPAPAGRRQRAGLVEYDVSIHRPSAPAPSATSAARPRGTAARWRSPAPPARRAPARRGR